MVGFLLFGVYVQNVGLQIRWRLVRYSGAKHVASFLVLGVGANRIFWMSWEYLRIMSGARDYGVGRKKKGKLEASGRNRRVRG